MYYLPTGRYRVVNQRLFGVSRVRVFELYLQVIAFHVLLMSPGHLAGCSVEYMVNNSHPSFERHSSNLYCFLLLNKSCVIL